MYITHSTVSLYGNSSVNLKVLNPTGQYINPLVGRQMLGGISQISH